MHLNFEGNYRLARALADQVLTSLASSVAGRQTDAWAGPEVCSRDLGLTDWNRCAVFEEIARRLAKPPFTQQLNHNHQLQKLAADLAECRLRLQDPRALDNARRTYEEALQKDPRDHWLHHNYAEFLANTGDLGAATEQMRAVQALAPQHQAACLQLGRLLASQGNLEEALREYAKAGTFHQDDARVRFLEAEVLEKQKKRSQAIHSLRDAIALRPSYWEAHERLGMELGLSGESSGAVAEFEHVVRLRPGLCRGPFEPRHRSSPPATIQPGPRPIPNRPAFGPPQCQGHPIHHQARSPNRPPRPAVTSLWPCRRRREEG